jgi:hypothetical protein
METWKKNAEFLLVDQIIEQIGKISEREKFVIGTVMRTSKNDNLRLRWILFASNENILQQRTND